MSLQNWSRKRRRKTQMDNTIKALSVAQPWATMLITGTPDGRIKKGETRTRRTNHRGPLLIVSTLKENKAAMAKFGFAPGSLPLGKAIGVIDVWDCEPMVKDDEKLALCPIYPRAYIWRTRNPLVFPHFLVKGNQGFYNVGLIKGLRGKVAIWIKINKDEV